jgi:hypothetical protein
MYCGGKQGDSCTEAHPQNREENYKILAEVTYFVSSSHDYKLYSVNGSGLQSNTLVRPIILFRTFCLSISSMKYKN